jgi:hypothetical protein
MYDAWKSAKWKPDPKLLANRDFCPSLAKLLYEFGRNVTEQVGPLTVLLSICEFYENRPRKYRTFGMSVFDITLRVYRNVEPRDTLKIKNALTVCLLRHRVHHRSLTAFETAGLQ